MPEREIEWVHFGPTHEQDTPTPPSTPPQDEEVKPPGDIYHLSQHEADEEIPGDDF